VEPGPPRRVRHRRARFRRPCCYIGRVSLRRVTDRRTVFVYVLGRVTFT
jgi:hypothetical protein